MSLGLYRYVDALGYAGIPAILSYRLCGYPRTASARHVTLPHPVTLRVGTSDISVFQEVISKQCYRFGLPDRPDVIVDAGANIGLASIFYAQKFPDARIFAIEAERSNFEAMLVNVRHYENIIPIHAALWSHTGTIRVIDPPLGASGHWGFAVAEGSGECAAITVPALMRQFGFEHIDLFKIDIEGAEKEVFAACDWQNAVGTVVIELHDRFKQGCSASVDRAFVDREKTVEGELTCYR